MTTQFLTADQIERIRILIDCAQDTKEFKSKLLPDNRTCILGEGIEAMCKPPRKRIPRTVQIFTQRYTQSDQPDAVKFLIAYVEKFMPEVKGLLKYNCGRMN